MIILQESGAIDIESVRSYMLQYLADGSRSYSEPYFTVSEVNDYQVFSRWQQKLLGALLCVCLS